MKRFFVIPLIIILLGGLLLSGCSKPAPTTPATPTPAPPPAPPQVTKLTFANWAPPPNAESVAIEKWAKDFEERTGGRYDVEVVHGGAIANVPDSYDAIVNGIADMASFVPKEADKPFPIVTVSTLPLGYADCAVAYPVWFDLLQKGYFDKDLADIKTLFTFVGNNEDVSTVNPINSVAEFEGVKLVVPGGIQVQICQAVGAIPVAGGPPDAYQLVEKGIADGIYIASLGMKEFQWAELVHYIIKPMQFGKASHVIGMNKDVYNKMPDDVKAIVDAMIADPQYGLMVAEGWDAWINESLDYFYNEKGGQDIDWSAEEKAKLGALIAPMWQDWLDETAAAGQDGKAALDALYNGLKAAGIENPTPGYTP